jgi:uncharacterized protein
VPSYARAVIADSGFVVSLFGKREPAHEAALTFTAAIAAPLIAIQGVITETCFFLRPNGRRALMEWVARGGVELIELPASAYAETAAIMRRYENLDPDFVDCALVWLAGRLGCRRIATLPDISPAREQALRDN